MDFQEVEESRTKRKRKTTIKASKSGAKSDKVSMSDNQNNNRHNNLKEDEGKSHPQYWERSKKGWKH